MTVDSDRCAGCGKCVEACPNAAISMSDVIGAHPAEEARGP
jgi:ferredoxin